jgi:DNA (cytosine-5)-methyltransferase 1
MVKMIDLFCGAGFLSAGFVNLGAEPVLAIDMDRFAVSTYNRNHSRFPVARVGDVRQIPDGITADILVAGPPCQGFSTLGRRDPSDYRNELSCSVFEWALAVKPRAILVENVEPYLRSIHYKKLAESLRGIDYNVTSFTLDARKFGVAQARRRSFVVALKSGTFDVPHCVKAEINVDVALEGLPSIESDPMSERTKLNGIASLRVRHVPPGGDKRDIMLNAPHLCPPSWFKMGCQATDVWGRIKLGLPANTIRCSFFNPSKGRYLHPTEDRMITLREALRLQGVPDWWQIMGPRTVACRQIGNGVPIPLAEQVARQILEVLH